MKKKVLLSYSGGLDTSNAIVWLKNNGYDVVSMIADFGEEKDYKLLQSRAIEIGSSKCHIVDVKDEFVNNYVTPAIHNNALYEGKYPLISSLSRPLIAKLLVDIAHEENINIVAHGCTGKGNDQVRFNVSIRALDPNMEILMPIRDCPTPRDEMLKSMKKYNFSLSKYSVDENLWGRSCECGELEDPWVQPSKNAYGITNSPKDSPDTPEIIEIEFNEGTPISLNNEKIKLSSIITKLNKIAGKHGIGRIDMIENRLVGIKSREIYEAPAAMTIIKAHKILEDLTILRDMSHFKVIMENEFANLVYDGLWFSPLVSAIIAFTKETQKNVSGIVKMELYKGNIIIIGRKSNKTLYDFNLATYDKEDIFDHSSADGFTKIWGLPLKTYSKKILK